MKNLIFIILAMVFMLVFAVSLNAFFTTAEPVALLFAILSLSFLISFAVVGPDDKDESEQAEQSKDD